MNATLNSWKLYDALEHHAQTSAARLQEHHPHAVEAFKQAGLLPGNIRGHAVKLLTSGALAASLFLAAPAITQAQNASLSKQFALLSPQERENMFAQEIRVLLTPTVAGLSRQQELQISDAIERYWGVSAYASLQGERLNDSYGLMGAEQHLPRYPGDTETEHEAFVDKGITPGKGAWGYFAPSKAELTQDLIAKEKYYVAVQTLYLPDWNTRLLYLRDWYKYRKVIVINPLNGKTIICDIADSGPSNFTGKQFGGSPEVMAYLGLNTGMQKGNVVLFFVDDAGNKVPLGPLEYNKAEGKPLAVR